MEEELILEKPSKKHKEQAINFIEEVEKIDLDENIRFAGFGSLHKYKNDYEGWLEFIEKKSIGKTNLESLVPASTFFTVRKSDDKIVGIIDIRHELNEVLFNYRGHIGYSILPSQRRKGYAYKQLLLGLEFCKSLNIRKVLITCADYNIGSSKTIEKVGGVLENIVIDPAKNLKKRRYWIEQ